VGFVLVLVVVLGGSLLWSFEDDDDDDETHAGTRVALLAFLLRSDIWAEPTESLRQVM
jgi:hypothetical protein